jgi:hypothetical protein
MIIPFEFEFRKWEEYPVTMSLAVSDKWLKDGSKLTRDGFKTYSMCKYLL